MTRLFWTLFALFPLPLVVLLVAGPPELFERERLHAVQDVAALLDVEQIDWTRTFGDVDRVSLGQVLPDKGVEYERFGMAFEYDTSPDQPILITPTGFDTTLRYRVAEDCWDVPQRQLTLMRGC